MSPTDMKTPVTRYARSKDVGIAYQVFGEGENDLVVAFPFISNIDLLWESPAIARFLRRLAGFARVINFDRRGVGLSDPTSGPPTLEERIDDVRAVMDAAGSERAAVLGMSEGAATGMLFAATCPERVSSLVLWGAMARATWAEDYPWAPPREALLDSMENLIAPHWGEGATIEIFSPSVADNLQSREFQARIERHASTPMRIWELNNLFLDLDVREVVPSIRTPTLVMHRKSDRAVSIESGRWLASQIEGSEFVEFDGMDHFPWIGADLDEILNRIEEFVTGSRPALPSQRVLATVLFTDIVDSTAKASELGDSRWKAKLLAHQEEVRLRLERYHGREIKTTGDGFLATFDGPTRAVECARAIATDRSLPEIEVRAGLHTGEIELMGDDVGGIAVHVASRICGLAGAGQVLASRTVRDLTAGSAIDFEEFGQHRLKGVPDEWKIYSVASTPDGYGPESMP